jgi:hypothetical protein
VINTTAGTTPGSGGHEHGGPGVETYGVFAGIIVLLFRLWITSYAVLGAEINAEAEQQTIADTTRGPARPLGQRDAVKADSAAPPNPSPTHHQPKTEPTTTRRTTRKQIDKQRSTS